MSCSRMVAMVLTTVVCIGASTDVSAQRRGLSGGLLGAGVGGAFGGSSGALAGAAIGTGVGLAREQQVSDQQAASAAQGQRENELLEMQMRQLELERELLEAERRLLEAERAN